MSIKSHSHLYLDIDTSRISGNGSSELKQILVYITRKIVSGFAQSVGHRLQLTEASIVKKEEEPEKTESRVVLQIVVDKDMLNTEQTMHGGCAAYLIDLCSTLSLVAFNYSRTGEIQAGVSQSINIVYHSPAQINDQIRIVNTTMTVGARAMSARAEIWNVTKHRLVASGVHIKMDPSLNPKPRL